MTSSFPSRIFLTGFMGSGKTSIGRELAILMKREFIDTDKKVEELANKSISDIFAEDGEALFRKLEKDVVKTVVTGDPGVVVALGGGAICQSENLSMVLDSGYLVYIQLPPPVLASRLQNDRANRPLLPKGHDDIHDFVERTLRERSPFYERAHLMVNGMNLGAPLLYEILRSAIRPGHG